MQRHCDLEAWRIFLNVVEAGSIAKASDESEMAPSNICRILNALEESLGGVILFERSSPIILTSAGHIALMQARILVSQHDAMLDRIFTNRNPYTGRVRISGPSAFFDNVLLESTIAVKNKYPNLVIEICSGGSFFPPISFLELGRSVDIVIGFGPDISQHEIKQIPLGSVQCVAAAFPLYIREYGYPMEVNDLQRHKLLLFGHSKISETASFDNGDTDIFGKFRTCTFYPTVSSLVKAGVLGNGIIYCAQALNIYKEIEDGELVPLDNLWRFPIWKYYLYLNPRTRERDRVRLLAREIEIEIKAKLQLADEVLSQHSRRCFLC